MIPTLTHVQFSIWTFAFLSITNWSELVSKNHTDMKPFVSLFFSFCLWASAASTNSSTYGATPSQLANIKLILYSNYSFDNYTSVLIADAAELMDSIDANKRTVAYIHGWTECSTSTSVKTVISGYIERGDHNVILVDYAEIADMDYLDASSSVSNVGLTVASGIDSMVDNGLNTSTFYVVGHSLGGQVAGAIGRNLSFNLSKIIGLDPAGPYFGIGQDICLSPSDADYVITIHTDAGYYGTNNTDGTVNFYPNDGRSIQPGCADNDTTTENLCCHYRSWEFFAESLTDEDAFIGVECESWVEFKSGACSSNPTAIMGYATPLNITGQYYLQTSNSAPYGRGVAGETYEA